MTVSDLHVDPELLALQADLTRKREAARASESPPPTAPRTPVPAPLGAAVPEAVGTLVGMSERLRTWQESPEGKRHLAHATRLEEERARRELLERCGARGVPSHPSIRACAVDASPPRTPALVVLEEALAWRRAHTTACGAPPLVVVLAGPPGVGKTTAVSRLVARWARSALLVLARDVADAPGSWEERAGLRARLTRVDLLALDECGAEEGERAGPRLTALLRERHDHGRVTVATTNLPGKEFVGRYVDDRVRSRLKEQHARGLGWWFPLPEGDLRDPELLASFKESSRG